MKTTKCVTSVLVSILTANIVMGQINSSNFESIKVHGQTLKYIEKGRGETLILLHGLGSNAERWTKNINELSKSYNVIALDQIGFGYSDKPIMPYNGATLVEFLQEFMVQKKINKATLIGNSMGGWVASLFAITYPEKVKRLILVNPAFLLGLNQNANIDEMYDFANPTTIEGMQNYVSKIYFDNNDLQTSEKLKELLATKISWNDGYAVYQILKSLKREKYLLTDKLKEIKAPTLIIHGEKDLIVPMQTVETLAEEITKNKLIKYENSGHSPMYTESNRFNKDILTYLKENNNE